MKIITTDYNKTHTAIVIGDRFSYYYSLEGGFRYQIEGVTTAGYNAILCHAPSYIAEQVCEVIDDFLASERSGKLDLSAKIKELDKEYTLSKLK